MLASCLPCLVPAMAESGKLSKSARKNRKRSEKRSKERVQQIKENGAPNEVIEMKDPVAVLREQLQEAKESKNHKLAAALRQQVWIAQDSAAGMSMDQVKSLGGDVDPSKDLRTNLKSEVTKTVTATALEPSQPNPPSDGLTSVEKKLRALRKKLQQIENLKEKSALGERLEKIQIEKIRREKEILEEVAEIEALLTGS